MVSRSAPEPLLPAPALEGTARPAVPAPAMPGRGGLSRALLVSLLLHLAPLGLLALPAGVPQPVGAGEEAMAVDMVISEAEMEAAPPSDAPTQTATLAASADSSPATPAAPPTPPPEPVQEAGEPVTQALTQPLPQAEQPSMAASAAAPPPASAEPVSAAASQAYQARVARHLARFKRFPAGASLKAEARVMVQFALDRTGQVLAVHVERASGLAAFDLEAMEMVRRAAPFPPPPPGSGERSSFTIPVTYRLRG